jgi:hypothetical protein
VGVGGYEGFDGGVVGVWSEELVDARGVRGAIIVTNREANRPYEDTCVPLIQTTPLSFIIPLFFFDPSPPAFLLFSLRPLALVGVWVWVVL